MAIGDDRQALVEVDWRKSSSKAHVVYSPWDWEFASRKGLKVAYHDEFMNVAVAIRPELETGQTVAPPAAVRLEPDTRPGGL